MRRVFISYGRDEHAEVAERIAVDLRDRGHEVWFDLERLKPGVDWERRIEEGLDWVSAIPGAGRAVLLMTPHSVRRPDGYCLNEIARALERRVPLIPVMLVWCEPPLSICRIQWLDMKDCVPITDRVSKYEAKFQLLADALEKDMLSHEGALSRLLHLLNPLPFDADIQQHLRRFTGRQWVFRRIDAWLSDPNASRIFWITGKPGVGKTALACWLCHRRSEVAAFHLCRFGHVQKSDPRKCVLSIAYQLSSQLPDYQMRLSAMNLEQIIPESDARTLFDLLLVQPLSSNFPAPDRIFLILIDALDEATEHGKNELASFLSSEFAKTPEWLRLIITSRAEPEVSYPLQALTPYVLDASAAENEEDMREYLLRELKHFHTGDPDSLSTTVENLLYRSEGLFLYLEWIREELEQGRLSLERLDEFPQGLGGVYAQFFARRFADTDWYQEHILPALEVIAAVREPVPLEFIVLLFDWKDRQRNQFLRSVGSLFPVTGEGIRPFHRSVLGWLTIPDRAGPYYVSVADGHSKLAEFGWRQYQQFQEGSSPLSPYFVAHLPTHCAEAKKTKELRDLLTDLNFVSAKCGMGMTYDLVSDYHTAKQFWSNAKQPTDVEHIMRKIRGAERTTHMSGGDEGSKKERDPIQSFSTFVSRNGHILSVLPSEILPVARNYAAQGVVAEQASALASELERPWVARDPRPPEPSTHPLSLRTLQGHEGAITAVAITADGKSAVSGSEDLTIRLWDLSSGDSLCNLSGHEDKISDVAFLPGGTKVLSAGWDRTLRIWDLSTRECLKVLKNDAVARRITISPDGSFVLAACEDNQIQVWDLSSGTLRRSLVGHTDKASCVTLAPDDDSIAVSGSEDNTLRVWNIATGNCEFVLNGHTWWINDVVVFAHGSFAVSASSDETLRLWDLRTGDCMKVLEGHQSWINGVAACLNGRLALSAGEDGSLRLWDLQTYECLRVLREHSRAITRIAVTKDAKTSVTSSDDHTLRVWDIINGTKDPSFPQHYGRIGSILTTPNGSKVVSRSADQTARVWDFGSGQCMNIMKGQSRHVFPLAVTPDSRVGISPTMGSLRAWDLQTGRVLRTLSGYAGTIETVAVTPDGKVAVAGGLAVTGGYDKTIRAWDVPSGSCLRLLSGTASHRSPDVSKNQPLFTGYLRDAKRRRMVAGHDEAVTALTFIPGGRFLVSSTWDRSFGVWDLATGRCFGILASRTGSREERRRTEENAPVAVTPDGKIGVSANWQKTIVVWDIRSGKILQTLQGAPPSVQGVVLTPDGKMAVSTGYDRSIYVWDTSTGTLLRRLDGHTGDINQVVLSLDGNLAISASMDKTLRVWNLRDGNCLAVYCALGSPTVITGIGMDGRFACGTEDGKIHFLTLQNIRQETPILTAFRLFHYALPDLRNRSDAEKAQPLFSEDDKIPGYYVDHPIAICPNCGRSFAVPAQIRNAIDTIQRSDETFSSCLKIPAQVWKESSLLSECFHCRIPLRFNPFVARPEWLDS